MEVFTLENSGNFTIIVPNEFNFLLYLYNWIDKKEFPHFEVRVENLDINEIKKNIIEQWNLYFEQLLNNGEYIQYIEVENSLAEEVLVGLDSKQKENIVNQYNSWWYHQSSIGYYQIIEKAISYHKKINLIRSILNIETYPYLLITYDSIPKEFSVNNSDFYFISQNSILNL